VLFRSENPNGIIIDEFQHVPDILSYIQLDVDAKKRPGYFILTGSQNFLMNQAITQTLAGRVGILTLPPLSLHEMKQNNLLNNKELDEIIFNGGYPKLYSENLTPAHIYPSYVQTYIERNVRQLTNIGDLKSFQKFIQLCAGRIGQLLNLSEIAGVCGISVSTTQRWISILEASYILFFLQPYFKNFNKRLTKSPKIYFYDTGLACSLLGIDTSKILTLHTMRGNIFENFIIADIAKQYFNIGKRPPIYFWRDLNGRIEIDCIIEEALKLYPIEIKSGETIAKDYFNGLQEWNNISNTEPNNNYLIYGGNLKQERSVGNIIGWKNIGDFVEKIRNN
jgi:predicted AAA+ superfamily ATPase